MKRKPSDTQESIRDSKLTNRTQNALPVWYTHSTVTGSETALGHDVKRRQESSSASNRRESGGKSLDPERDLEAHYADLMGDGESDDEADEDDDVKPVVPTYPEVKVERGSREEETGDHRVKIEPGMEDEDMYPEEEEEGHGDRVFSASATPGTGTATATASGTPVGEGETNGLMVMGELLTVANSSCRRPNTRRALNIVAGVPKPFDEVTDEDTDHLMTEEEREVSLHVIRQEWALM